MREHASDFLIIGAAKAGTTSLYHYLRSHPKAFMPARKETSVFCEEFSVFCEEFRWKNGLDWYESQFEGADSAVAVGEASPRYTAYPIFQGWRRGSATTIPEARLVYLVREPIKRMQSQYLDNLINGLETTPVEDALSTNPFYLTSSRYALQLQQQCGSLPKRSSCSDRR
jgi:hypothetical protein